MLRWFLKALRKQNPQQPQFDQKLSNFGETTLICPKTISWGADALQGGAAEGGAIVVWQIKLMSFSKMATLIKN